MSTPAPIPARSPWRRGALAVLVVAVGVGLVGNLVSFRADGATAIAPTALVVALGLIAASGCVLLLVTWLVFLRPRPGLVTRGEAAVALGWGAFVATGLAIIANGAMSRVVVHLAGPAAIVWAPPASAPWAEEALKALAIPVVIAVGSRGVRTPLQAMVLGILAGIGFQVLENVVYGVRGAFDDPSDDLRGALTVTVARASLGLLDSHWIFSGSIGLGLGLLLAGGARSRGRRWGGAAGAIAFGVIAHVLLDIGPGAESLVRTGAGRGLVEAEVLLVQPLVFFVFAGVVVAACRGHRRVDGGDTASGPPAR